MPKQASGTANRRCEFSPEEPSCQPLALPNEVCSRKCIGTGIRSCLVANWHFMRVLN
jgi:hypothetical protein